MIIVDDVIFSDDIRDKLFVCDLARCKGTCCVEGESGAPLEKEECEILKKESEHYEAFLSREGLIAINKQGHYVHGKAGFNTPLVRGHSCAYSMLNEKGIVKCGIEQAWEAGKTNFQKPLSCHLYPIRLKEHHTFTAANYEHWDICDPACKNGSALQIPVYRFLKTALIRKFGPDFYQRLEEAIAASQG